MAKIFVIILFLIILGSLASAGVFLIKGEKENSHRMVKALSIRIGLSIFAFLIIIACFAFGIIESNPTPY